MLSRNKTCGEGNCQKRAVLSFRVGKHTNEQKRSLCVPRRRGFRCSVLSYSGSFISSPRTTLVCRLLLPLRPALPRPGAVRRPVTQEQHVPGQTPEGRSQVGTGPVSRPVHCGSQPTHSPTAEFWLFVRRPLFGVSVVGESFVASRRVSSRAVCLG